MSVNWYDYKKKELISPPPVGTVCEYYNNGFDGGWERCTVVAVNGVAIAFTCEGEADRIYVRDTFSQSSYKEFRPLDASKEELISKATDILYQHACATKGELVDGARALYEAGMLVNP